MDSVVPDFLKMPLAIGAMQLPSAIMQHREAMQAQEHANDMEKASSMAMEKFMANLVEGVNTW